MNTKLIPINFDTLPADLRCKIRHVMLDRKMTANEAMIFLLQKVVSPN